MTIKIFDCCSDKTKLFTGTPEQLVVQLDDYYGWLKRYNPVDLKERLSLLGRQQFFFVSVED
jgi:hypothetical protein